MAKYTKRRDKRGYEWKSAYREKEALMLERGYLEVSPHDFYRELFPAGSLQQEPEDGKGIVHPSTDSSMCGTSTLCCMQVILQEFPG